MGRGGCRITGNEGSRFIEDDRGGTVQIIKKKS